MQEPLRARHEEAMSLHHRRATMEQRVRAQIQDEVLGRSGKRPGLPQSPHPMQSASAAPAVPGRSDSYNQLKDEVERMRALLSRKSSLGL